MTTPDSHSISLLPLEDGALHALLQSRRSVKRFTDRAVSLRDVASLLSAVTGEGESGHRAIPSARAAYPVAVTLIAGCVDGLAAGAYRYDGGQHVVTSMAPGDHRRALAEATLDVGWIASCAALVLLSADLEVARTRFTDQPPAHGERFVWLEAGCMAQNAYLWAAEHRLGTALIAGVDDDRAHEVTTGLLPTGHDLLGILPIGHPASAD